MIDRRVAVLLVVDVVLLAAIGLTRPGGSAPEPIPFRLPALTELTGLEIARTGQPKVALKRGADGWTAAGDPMDPTALQALTESLEQPLGADLAINIVGAELDDYGLGEQAITVRFSGPGAPSAPVRIGRVVDGRRTFVWPVGDGRIYRLRADLGRVFERPAMRWPDQRLVSVGIEALAELNMTRGGALNWRARREAADTPWVLDHPPALVVGQDEVGAVAATLVTARAEGFEAPDGFEAAAVLEARTFDGRTFAVALRPDRQGSLLARIPGRRQLVRVPRHQAVFLDVRAGDLRERRVFGLEMTADAVDGIAIAGTEPLRLARDEAGRWRMQAPRAAGPLPEAGVERWLSAVVGLRVVGFADPVAADAFAAPQRIDFDVDGRQVTLELGALFGNGARLARRLDRPQRVFVLGASALLLLRPDVEALVGEPAPGAQPSER